MSCNTLLVIGAGPLHVYTIREAQAIGLRVVCTDANPNAPGCALADEHFILDVYGIEWHRIIAQTLKDELLGCVCCGGDAAPTVAAVCQEAGLLGIPFAVAERTWDKYEVRFQLEKAGLERYQPHWGRWHIDRMPLPQIEDEIGNGVVIKPLSQRASRGLTIVRHVQDIPTALAKVRQYGETFLCEQYLAGTEHSAEIVLDAAGACIHYHCCDRFFSYDNGLPLELGHINPSRLKPYQLQAIKTMLLESATAMGVTIGSWKCDVMWTDAGPKIIEATARCSGGFDAQLSYPHSSGDNLLRRVIQVACGFPVASQPPLRHDHFCAVAAILPRKAGLVEGLFTLGGEVLWLIKPGVQVHPPRHNAERVGFVVVEGARYEETWETAAHLATDYADALAALTS